MKNVKKTVLILIIVLVNMSVFAQNKNNLIGSTILLGTDQDSFFEGKIKKTKKTDQGLYIFVVTGEDNKVEIKLLFKPNTTLVLDNEKIRAGKPLDIHKFDYSENFILPNKINYKNFISLLKANEVKIKKQTLIEGEKEEENYQLKLYEFVETTEGITFKTNTKNLLIPKNSMIVCKDNQVIIDGLAVNVKNMAQFTEAIKKHNISIQYLD